MLKHLVHSPARVAALGKYFIALAKSFSAPLAATRRTRQPSSKRKRLHLLYVLNDVLHHVHVRDRDSGLAAKAEPFLPDLVRYAAAFANSPKHAAKIQGLVSLWHENGYFPPEFIEKLRAVIEEAPKLEEAKPAANGTADGAGAAPAAKTSKDAPFVMPAMHGDATAPWYDLPAANWLPVIEPNSTRPMNPDMIKPLQFVPGPADKRLIQAVTDLLADVDRIYAKEGAISDSQTEDIDQLGQRIIVDEITGDIIGGETYYGWSRPFCEKMKQRRKNGGRDGQRGRSSASQSRSRSRSSSRGSSSRPAFKRRRMTDSRSPSRSRSRSRSRSYSRDRRRPRSNSASRSRSPPPPRRGGWRDDRSQSRSPLPPPRPYQQQPAPPAGAPYGGGGQQQYPPPQPQPGFHPAQFQPPHHASFPPPPPPPFPIPVPADFNQFVPPPPPPPNYQGQWPPPPPPPPPGGAMPNWMSGPGPAIAGGWVGGGVPPPHNMPQQQQDHQYQYHGGGGGGGGAEYQYSRGRGRGAEYRGQSHPQRGGGGGGWNNGRGPRGW